MNNSTNFLANISPNEDESKIRLFELFKESCDSNSKLIDIVNNGNFRDENNVWKIGLDKLPKIREYRGYKWNRKDDVKYTYSSMKRFRFADNETLDIIACYYNYAEQYIIKEKYRKLQFFGLWHIDSVRSVNIFDKLKPVVEDLMPIMKSEYSKYNYEI